MSRLPSNSPDDAIDAAAAAWISRRDAGLSSAERVELEQWCAQDARHRLALSRFDSAWTALGRPQRTGGGGALAKELDALVRRDRRRRRQMAAAGLAAGLLVGLAWWHQEPAARDRHSVETAAVILVPERRVLEDGSIVEFPAGTEIVVDFTESFRRVALKKGEAHFQVAKNAARPFLVEASGVEVRAVGTAFAVQKGHSAVEILVTEGRVAVHQTSSAAQGQSSPSAGERSPLALVDAGNGVVVSVASMPRELSPPPVQTIAKTQMAERLAWRSPGVEFSGTPLGDVVTFLNRHNAVELVIDDAKLKATPLSGRFRVDDTEAFVRMVETGFGATSSRRAGRIILRKSR